MAAVIDAVPVPITTKSYRFFIVLLSTPPDVQSLFCVMTDT